MPIPITGSLLQYCNVCDHVSVYPLLCATARTGHKECSRSGGLNY